MQSGVRGFTTADQVSFFVDKEKKLIEGRKWPPEYEVEVNMSKVNMDVMSNWIQKRITELLGIEDDIVVDYCKQQLFPVEDASDTSTSKKICPKKLQINLTGFLAKNAATFVKELWGLLLSAQESPNGIPHQFINDQTMQLEEKQAEARQVKEALEQAQELSATDRRSPSRGRMSQQRDRSVSRSRSKRDRRSRSRSPRRDYRRKSPPPRDRRNAPQRRRSFSKSRSPSHRRRSFSRSPSTRRHQYRSPVRRNMHYQRNRYPPPNRRWNNRPLSGPYPYYRQDRYFQGRNSYRGSPNQYSPNNNRYSRRQPPSLTPSTSSPDKRRRSPSVYRNDDGSSPRLLERRCTRSPVRNNQRKRSISPARRERPSVSLPSRKQARKISISRERELSEGRKPDESVQRRRDRSSQSRHDKERRGVSKGRKGSIPRSISRGRKASMPRSISRGRKVSMPRSISRGRKVSIQRMLSSPRKSRSPIRRESLKDKRVKKRSVSRSPIKWETQIRKEKNRLMHRDTQRDQSISMRERSRSPIQKRSDGRRIERRQWSMERRSDMVSSPPRRRYSPLVSNRNRNSPLRRPPFLPSRGSQQFERRTNYWGTKRPSISPLRKERSVERKGSLEGKRSSPERSKRSRDVSKSNLSTRRSQPKPIPLSIKPSSKGDISLNSFDRYAGRCYMDHVETAQQGRAVVATTNVTLGPKNENTVRTRDSENENYQPRSGGTLEHSNKKRQLPSSPEAPPAQRRRLSDRQRSVSREFAATERERELKSRAREVLRKREVED